MKQIFLEVAQEIELDLKEVISQIETFEDIYKTRKNHTRQLAKDILIELYQERDSYANKAKFYRNLCERTENGRAVFAWR